MTANKLHFHLVFPLKKLASEIETVCQMVVSFFLFRNDNLIKERGPLSFTGLASCLCERYLRSVAHTQTHTHTHTHTRTHTHTHTPNTPLLSFSLPLFLSRTLSFSPSEMLG